MYSIHKNTIYLFFIAIILILLSGLRVVGGDPDSLSYEMHYNSFISLFESNYTQHEPFHYILIAFSKQFTDSVNGLFLLYSLIQISIIFYAINKLRLDKLLAVAIYICLFYILYAFVQIRVGVSVSIFLLSLYDIVNRNKMSFYVKMLFAFLFHYTAIIYLFFFMLDTKHINRIIYALLPIIGIIVGLLGKSIIFNLVEISNFLPDFISNKLLHSIALVKEGYFHPLSILSGYTVFKLLLYYTFLISVPYMKGKYTIVSLKVFGWSIFIMYLFMSISIFAVRLSDILAIVLIPLIIDFIKSFKQKEIILISVLYFSFVMFAYSYFGYLKG